MTRPSFARIDLDAIRHNLALAAGLAPKARSLAVIKADAYGHGAVAVARALASSADAFAVAAVEEAQELRAAGIRSPILLLEGPQARDELDQAVADDFWLMITTPEQLQMVEQARPDKPLTVWLKFDTGMHRLGLPLSLAQDAVKQLRALSHIQPEIVLATHLACADEPGHEMTLQQVQAFAAAVGPLDAPLSIANSAGILAWPQTHADWLRPGYLLYGDSPFDAPQANASALRPAMSVFSQVMALRDVPAGASVGYGATWTAARPSRIATVPMGYGDGYPRHAPSGTPVLVADQRAALVGRVSMDLLTVDVTDLAGVEVGAEVELWGRNLPVGEVARAAGTIGYELLAGLPRRLRREYVA